MPQVFLPLPWVRRRAGRRGYLYLAVLATAAIVSAMGMAALSVAALQLRSTRMTNDAAAADLLARSAIEDALLQIASNSSWRSTFTNNAESTTRALGSGTYTFKLVDADGNLQDDDSDSVRLIGIGRAGDAVTVQSVLLLPAGAGLTCLEASLHAGGNVTLGTAVVFTTDQFVSTNGNLTASGFGVQVTGNAQAVGTISGTVTGTKTTGITPRQLPGSSVFDYYLDNGTWIPVASLPLSGSTRVIDKRVLGPTLNPFGPAGNPEGIYVIDCQGAQLCIKNSRIAGTLVIRNAAANSVIEGSVRWDAAVRNYPALLVDGTIEIKTNLSNLDEALLNTNFNPAGFPYEGNEDADTGDSYPSEIEGLVYVSGTLNLPADLLDSAFRGVVVAPAVAANSKCRFNYDDLFFNYPPPGFARGNPMAVSPGSWQRESLAP